MIRLLLTVIAASWISLLGCIPKSSKNYTRPNVWIYTDMSDSSIPGNNHMGTVNDPDDISAMAGYLLMANEFNTLGIVITSTHRKEHKVTPDQAAWAQEYFGTAYATDLPGLQEHIGGYPDEISFMQSCIKESAERFNPEEEYINLSGYSTIDTLCKVAMESDQPIYVLCWGSLTEPAILVSHCLSSGKKQVLDNLYFIAHWTNSSLHQGTPEHPEHVANCREDAEACAFLKEQAAAGKIAYYECGAIGQHGIVSGAPKGDDYYDQYKVSALGNIFVNGKYVNEHVDHSDAATYWTLLGKWGVSLKDIPSDGSNNPERERTNEEKFVSWSASIHDELLRRTKLAANK